MLTLPNIDHLAFIENGGKFEITVDTHATVESFHQLLKWLPSGSELFFHDQYYPTISDPGAYVAIRRNEDNYIYHLGNHGWSSDWRPQSMELLALLMQLNLTNKYPQYPYQFSITLQSGMGNPWLK